MKLKTVMTPDSGGSGGGGAADDGGFQLQQQPQDARSSNGSSAEERGDSDSKRPLEDVRPLCDFDGGVAAPTPLQGATIITGDAQLPPFESEGEEGDAVTATQKASSTTTIQATAKGKNKCLSEGADKVGAVQVNDVAPELNRRFYLGLNRPSVVRRVRERAARRRSRRRREQANTTAADHGEGDPSGQKQATALATAEEGGGGEGGGRVVQQPWDGVQGSVRPPDNADRDAGAEVQGTATIEVGSQGYFGYRRSRLIEASLVEEDASVVLVTAEPVGFFARTWRVWALTLCAGLTALATALYLALTGVIDITGAVASETATPSPSPTFDQRPTLEITQERGHIRCGLSVATIEAKEGFHYDLCRSVAAVVMGDPDSFKGVPISNANRWQHLVDRAVDVVILGDTHTIEREVNESSTRSGFTFSSPIFYDGMVYTGNDTFVHCAEEQKRFAECSSLMICMASDTSYYAVVHRAFPSKYIKVVSSTNQLVGMLLDDDCNVLASEFFFVQSVALKNATFRGKNFTVGTKRMSMEPHAIVTNNRDREFSDVVNWVVQALLFGEEEGLRRDAARCQNYTDGTSHPVSDLRFLNAVFCVGNYAEILLPSLDDQHNRGRNNANNGTGMLFATPFGNLDREDFADSIASSTVAKIRNRTLLRCGVVVPRGFEGNVTDGDNLVGMGADYCRALAAAICIGDHDAVNFSKFAENGNSSIIALANGNIDVLVGERVQQRYDFEIRPSLGGLYFSTPYYYGDPSIGNAVSFYSMATGEGDALFASFVNTIVLATIYAQENDIKKESSENMPHVSIFGRELSWALKDAIAHSGSYDEMYTRNFGSRASEEYGDRNTLNTGGPLMHSLPMNTSDES